MDTRESYEDLLERWVRDHDLANVKRPRAIKRSKGVKGYKGIKKGAQTPKFVHFSDT